MATAAAASATDLPTPDTAGAMSRHPNKARRVGNLVAGGVVLVLVV